MENVILARVNISSVCWEAQDWASFHLYKLFNFWTQKGIRRSYSPKIFGCASDKGKKLGIYMDEHGKIDENKWKVRESYGDEKCKNKEKWKILY